MNKNQGISPKNYYNNNVRTATINDIDADNR